MNNKEKRYNDLYMDIAVRVSNMSYCDKRKVGSIIVKNGRIISMGWNGMPAKMVNCCEDGNGNTKPEVSHAEENSILKLTQSTDTATDSLLYVTTAPCIICAKLIYNSGIKEVFYNEIYRNDDGIKYLEDRKIPVTRIKVK